MSEGRAGGGGGRLPPYRRVALLYAAALGSLHTSAAAWSGTGRAVTAEIAYDRLGPGAKNAIDAILGLRSLADAAAYPDLKRADPDPFWRYTAPPYHYVTVIGVAQYEIDAAPPEGDAVTALHLFSSRLRAPGLPEEDTFTALAFVVHIVGDLHQPFHVGNGLDRGGNDYQISAPGGGTNLHALWDELILARGGLDVGSAATLAATIAAEQGRRWSVVDPEVWIAESLAVRRQVYPKGHSVDEAYLHDALPVATTRLRQAGVRIAAFLDCLFDDVCAVRNRLLLSGDQA